MKSPVFAVVLGAAALALPMTAPTQAMAQAAAGTVPNTFDNAAPQQAAPAPQPAAAARPANANAAATIRTIISGMKSNSLDFSLFTDELAGKIREQQAQIFPILQGFGEVQAVDFVRSQEGADLFIVTFAAAQTQWVIGFDDAGKVDALLFRPVPEGE
ncbi:MAG: hypothetical protein REJ23_11565 [Brevundimonas sp.]|nr:hypothetical protein [Brevundimonas sp.]